MHWQTSRFRIDLSRPQVMGILNVTPDSFSDGGRHASLRDALRRAEVLLQDGADILDIGGESTRPGSPAVPLEEELARVVPVVKEAVAWRVPISVDTYKPAVMQAVLDLGADIVNDIWALRQPGALETVARHGTCGVCLMHMHGEPQTMQVQPMEGDVVAAVQAFLGRQADALHGQGVARDRIVLDPGIGFGKTVEQNFALLAQQARLATDGHAWLAGWSRKSSLGAVTGLPVQDRLVPSVAAALLSVERGARIVRVHDVAETFAALRIWCAARLPSEGSGASRASGPARPQP
ncbi:dihydropteroate synthase [Paracidovorax citrulli]|uniref:Dihydropteroate synthase n=2 Tax=Paracidovorax citrulli TaxID=80869 RepID=A1TQF2_PARC0|nr:dihydropteroate synthase [Paracidovorax citrulli]ABM33190.1 Dihydropteroate synthase [Paracidovorax citrulli AAC00-1]ATG92870.1 dihydropteroate synthase [Paracidovorax citrulli]MVT36660.1 dihydropteroate synthase [Paracidovorax citrulli]PVY67420.1 dihydropteroate synthase [Paracidovorax citrulli]QCX13089.1 Dihydropteroate synthase [Paracidovorax citrulli]